MRRSYVGNGNPAWKGGRVKSVDGRSLVQRPGHPMARCDGYVLEYRIVMSEKIGRILGRKEIVHHINGDRNDNRPENLELMTQAEHARLHVKRDPKTGRIVGDKRRNHGK